jgi:hypothetical protein
MDQMMKIFRVFQITIGTILIMGLFSGLFGGEKPIEKKKDFPSVPDWEPKIAVPIDKLK